MLYDARINHRLTPFLFIYEKDASKLYAVFF